MTVEEWVKAQKYVKVLEAEAATLREALEELADLMDEVLNGTYTPDSFTTQPARAALSTSAGKAMLEQLREQDEVIETLMKQVKASTDTNLASGLYEEGT